jgi:hypothetical protein
LKQQPAVLALHLQPPVAVFLAALPEKSLAMERTSDCGRTAGQWAAES